jgi:hypothetical protein
MESRKALVPNYPLPITNYPLPIQVSDRSRTLIPPYNRT